MAPTCQKAESRTASERAAANLEVNEFNSPDARAIQRASASATAVATAALVAAEAAAAVTASELLAAAVAA